MKLIITEQANEELLYCTKYISNAIRKRLPILVKFPKLGKVVSEFNRDDIRELILYKRRVIYKLGDDIKVLSITLNRLNVAIND